MGHTALDLNDGKCLHQSMTIIIIICQLIKNSFDLETHSVSIFQIISVMRMVSLYIIIYNYYECIVPGFLHITSQAFSFYVIHVMQLVTVSGLTCICSDHWAECSLLTKQFGFGLWKRTSQSSDPRLSHWYPNFNTIRIMIKIPCSSKIYMN